MQGRVQYDPNQSAEVEDFPVGGRDGEREGTKDPPTTEFTFARTLQSGETVQHDQTYTIEVDPHTSFFYFITTRKGLWEILTHSEHVYLLNK